MLTSEQHVPHIIVMLIGAAIIENSFFTISVNIEHNGTNELSKPMFSGSKIIITPFFRCISADIAGKLGGFLRALSY